MLASSIGESSRAGYTYMTCVWVFMPGGLRRLNGRVRCEVCCVHVFLPDWFPFSISNLLFTSAVLLKLNINVNDKSAEVNYFSMKKKNCECV